MSAFTPEQLTELKSLFASWFEALGTPLPPEDKPALAPTLDPRFGTLDRYGSHTIEGQGDKRFFTLSGWDAAITDMQRANIAMQLGLTADGKFTSTGPAPVGFETNQLANRFFYPLLSAATSDGFGGTRRQLVDGPNSSAGRWLYPRVRVRARGYDNIMKALETSKQ